MWKYIKEMVTVNDLFGWKAPGNTSFSLLLEMNGYYGNTFS